MAAVVTEQSAGITTLEVRAFVAGGVGGAGMTILIKCEVADRCALFVSRAADNAVYLAASANRAVLYDLESGNIFAYRDVVPHASVTVQGGRIHLQYNIGDMASSPTTPTMPKVEIDFPTLLRTSGNVAVARKLENRGNGSYRLVGTLKYGWSAIYTVQMGSPLAFRGVEVRDQEGHTMFAMQLQLNEAAQTPIYDLPTVAQLGNSFHVSERSTPADLPSMIPLMSLFTLPLLIDAPAETQNGFDKVLGAKHDWQVMRDRYFEVLPKLRALLPMPN